MVIFILGEIRRQVQDEFIILLSTKDAVILFRENLNLFRRNPKRRLLVLTTLWIGRSP